MGSAEWQVSMNRRNRIEGMFGTLKQFSGMNMVRDTCHLRGLAKVSIATVMRMVVYSLHRIDSWRERERRRRIGRVGPAAAPPQAHRGLHPNNNARDTIPAAQRQRREAATQEEAGPAAREPRPRPPRATSNLTSTPSGSG
jgi:hypothetical protein